MSLQTILTIKAALNSLVWVFLAMQFIGGWGGYFRDHPWLWHAQFYGIVGLGICHLVFASISINTGNFGSAAWSVLIAAVYTWWAYQLWKRKPPRKKRRPSKVAAKIKERLGKLVVVPVGAS